MYDINEITIEAGQTREFKISDGVAGIALVSGDATYTDGSSVTLNSIVMLKGQDVEITTTTECVVGVVTLLSNTQSTE